MNICIQEAETSGVDIYIRQQIRHSEIRQILILTYFVIIFKHLQLPSLTCSSGSQLDGCLPTATFTHKCEHLQIFHFSTSSKTRLKVLLCGLYFVYCQLRPARAASTAVCHRPYAKMAAFKLFFCSY